MTGEVSLGGVFVPTLLVLFIFALGIGAFIIRLFGLFGFYRFVTYKALVDLAIFILTFGAITFLATYFGIQP